VGEAKVNVPWTKRYIGPLVPSWASGYMFLYQIIEVSVASLCVCSLQADHVVTLVAVGCGECRVGRCCG
jgi:hypothetical protein